jgi:predicted transcriptional regulator
MKANKGLQKLTETEMKINELLSLEKITRDDIKPLSRTELNYLSEAISKKFNSSKGEDRDKFYEKIEPITDNVFKNQVWEVNHNNITCAISNLMQDYGRMPSKAEIATKTELSRQTVHKHLKEYANHPLYLQQVEQFRFMTSKVLARVFQFAVNGDTGAAKLYFNVMGCLNNGQLSNNTLIQNQNNYIQINGTVLSQETLKHLNSEQLNSIENILKTALPTHISNLPDKQ